MKITPRAVWITVGVLAFTTAAIVYNVRYDPVAPLQRVHAVELPFDSARVRWWHQAATCLGIDTTYDRKLRYFVGDTIPKEWGSEPSRTTIIHGYTDIPNHLILLAPAFANDSALVKHEQLHDFHKIPGHPQQYFSGRCGVLAGQD